MKGLCSKCHKSNIEGIVVNGVLVCAVCRVPKGMK
tara:strand:+ start:223 stop:327 length:105 start_codon:yes stop_codon:yes gene_type:complete